MMINGFSVFDFCKWSVNQCQVLLCRECCEHFLFFFRPGEKLEKGIQSVYVLSEEDGLVIR